MSFEFPAFRLRVATSTGISMNKKIGFTQRVTVVEQYHELRDSLDRRWWTVAETLGFFPVPLATLYASLAAPYAESLDLSAIILTGGEDNATRDAFEFALIDWAIDKNIPIVGFCRGMQIMNQYFGGTRVEVPGHKLTRHDIVFCNAWKETQSREVNSYHDFGIYTQQLASELIPTALHEDGSVEAFIHPAYKMAGIMWHPERELFINTEDMALLRSLIT